MVRALAQDAPVQPKVKLAADNAEALPLTLELNHREHAVPIAKGRRPGLQTLYDRSFALKAKPEDPFFNVSRFSSKRTDKQGCMYPQRLRAFFRRLSK